MSILKSISLKKLTQNIEKIFMKLLLILLLLLLLGIRKICLENTQASHRPTVIISYRDSYYQVWLLQILSSIDVNHSYSDLPPPALIPYGLEGTQRSQMDAL